MSDSLTNFVLSYSTYGTSGPWTTLPTLLPPTSSSTNDSTQPNPVLWYKLSQTTASGVAVPYTVVSVSGIPMGHVTAVTDPDDPTSLIFTWDVPDGLPLPVSRFELSGKFLNDPDQESVLLDVFEGTDRTGRAPVVPCDDFSNPYTYSLTGFIDR